MATASVSLSTHILDTRPRYCCVSRQRVGQALHRVALWLSTPLHWTSGIIGKLVTPIASKEHRNHPNKHCEIASRTASVVGALIFSPVTLPTAVTGGVVQCIGNAIAPHPFYYIRGDAQPKAEKMRFFTLNACMFWGGLPMLFGGVWPAEVRMKALVELITRLNPPIFVAQEVAFGPGLKLASALKPYYSHIFLNIGPNPFRMESGLFVAIRCDLVSMPYFKAFGNERSLKHGIFCFETKRFSVMNTHLASGDAHASAVKMRQTQFEVITEETRTLLKKRKPCFLLGDLNCSRKEIPTRFFDRYQEKHPFENETTATCTNELTAWMRGKKTPPGKEKWELDDYALVAANKNMPDMDVELVRTFDLKKPSEAVTDHHGLLLTAEDL